MKPDEHIVNLGKIVANLHSLEFILRIFLTRLPGAASAATPWGVDIYSYPVGTKLPATNLTDYASLGMLISAYNHEVVTRGLGIPLDKNITFLRDALAHGRVSAPLENAPLQLIKFSKPKDGVVEIDFNETLDEQWFENNRRRIYDSIMQVNDTLAKLPEPQPPPQ